MKNKSMIIYVVEVYSIANGWMPTIGITIFEHEAPSLLKVWKERLVGVKLRLTEYSRSKICNEQKQNNSRSKKTNK